LSRENAMIKKYNLALIPISRSEEVIMLANKFSYLADSYLLCEKSLPHVTLYQFHAEESDISSTWKKTCQGWSHEPLKLVFTEFSCITFDNHIYWISLLPDNQDLLHQMHGYVANAISLPVKKSFDPHMTLINTKDKKYENEVAKFSSSYQPLIDNFILSLGVSDDIGQLQDIIYILE